jgi:phosphatidylserine decarboxylase
MRNIAQRAEEDGRKEGNKTASTFLPPQRFSILRASQSSKREFLPPFPTVRETKKRGLFPCLLSSEPLPLYSLRSSAAAPPSSIFARLHGHLCYDPAPMPSACKEALRFLIPLGILFFAAPVIALIFPLPGWLEATAGIVTLLCALFFLFVLYFFRDPERVLPADEAVIVSAADGLVVGVDEMEEPDFHLGRMIRIAVFLSVFDVHVNRSPVTGTVKSTIYKAGQFLDVRHPDSSTRNECRSWWLETPGGPVAVRQIAGLIARRIVAWSQEGSTLARGQRLGMIRFGSRTEVFLPPGCLVLVKPGDRVSGASTPIARWPRTYSAA